MMNDELSSWSWGDFQLFVVMLRIARPDETDGRWRSGERGARLNATDLGTLSRSLKLPTTHTQLLIVTYDHSYLYASTM